MVGDRVVARSRTVQRAMIVMVMMMFVSEASIHCADHEQNEGKHKNILTKSITHECLQSVVTLH